MPRQLRLDAPGTLHHVMGRGIETSKIFRTRKDREDFIDRLAELCRSGSWAVYAWALMPNHFHRWCAPEKSHWPGACGAR